VAEWVDTQLPAAPIQPELWTMFFDGSLMKTGAGAGLLLISPLRKHLCYVLRLHFPASNNVAEYEARRLEDMFYGLELNHIARRYNETADELAKIASGRTTVPPDVFSRDLHQPSVKTDDTPEPEKVSALPEAPSA
jgi:hypothetical protein